MLSRVARTIATHGLFEAKERVLVGLSGGPDSWALLLALAKLFGKRAEPSKAAHRLAIEAAHVDHGLRPESAAEARLVKAQCRAIGIPCTILRIDVRAALRPHVSLQDAARTLRLRAIEAHARKRRCGKVALAHHADDQAETILFRIVRGTGVRGLAGIPYRRGCFVRPLLDVRRAEILGFLRRHRVDYVSDPSNRDPRFTRARVRHQWLPLLEKENPKVVEALVALSRDAREIAKAGSGSGAPVRTVADENGHPVYLNRRAAEVVQRLLRDPDRATHVDVHGGRVVVSRGRAVFVPGTAGRAASRVGSRRPRRSGGTSRAAITPAK